MTEPDDSPWLIVGLGNPGVEYAGNRHNVGAMVIEQFAADTGASLRPHKARARAAGVRLADQRAVIAVPGSYMNESGGPIAGLMSFFKIPRERLIVIHDELDIPFASIRLKGNGGEGGHNGLRSITKSIGSKEYLRVRVGVGRPPGRTDAADYVLRNFNATERKELPFLIPAAIEATELLVRVGLTEAQNRIH